MKYIKCLFILAFSFQAAAGDIADRIFKNGFENTVSISGSAAGLNSSGLFIELRVENVIVEQFSVDADGGFFFSTELSVGELWRVGIIQLPTSPNQQSCAISNNSGSAPPGGVNDVLITCDDSAWEWDVMNWDEGGWQ